MGFQESVSTLRRVLNDCMYDFGSPTDRCLSIRVSGDSYSEEIQIAVEFHLDSWSVYSQSDIRDDIGGTIKSICRQYGINYDISYRIRFVD